MDQERERATAYHEAGHAVVAMALGRPVRHVTILPDGRFLGLCEFGKSVFRPSEDALERESLIALAGLAAEARYIGEYAWEGAAHDHQYVYRLCVERAGERRAERLLRRMLSKTEHLLTQEGHWRAVELIAAELLLHRSISGRTARHLFDRGLASC
jgi:ATP-dependent Zn protease